MWHKVLKTRNILELEPSTEVWVGLSVGGVITTGGVVPMINQKIKWQLFEYTVVYDFGILHQI